MFSHGRMAGRQIAACFVGPVLWGREEPTCPNYLVEAVAPNAITWAIPEV